MGKVKNEEKKEHEIVKSENQVRIIVFDGWAHLLPIVSHIFRKDIGEKVRA